MDFTTALMAVILIAFIFSVAYGLLQIHLHGFNLGRISTLKPTEPEKPVAPVVPKLEGPLVYSSREPLTTEPVGPMSEVPPHAESPL